jgi:hypothetical protein
MAFVPSLLRWSRIALLTTVGVVWATAAASAHAVAGMGPSAGAPCNSCVGCGDAPTATRIPRTVRLVRDDRSTGPARERACCERHTVPAGHRSRTPAAPCLKAGVPGQKGRHVRAVVGDPNDDTTSNNPNDDDDGWDELSADDDAAMPTIAWLQEKAPYVIALEWAPAAWTGPPSSPSPFLQPLRC